MKYSRLLGPLLIALVFTLKYTPLSAQSKDSIIGIWHVEEVAMTSKIGPEEQEAFDLIKKAFWKSTFTFKADHQAVVTSDDRRLAIDKGYWEYSADKKLITITEWKGRTAKQKGVLMGIVVRYESDGKTYFYLDETPIKLSVKR